MQAWLKTSLFLLMLALGLCGARADSLRDYLADEAGRDAEAGLSRLMQLDMDEATRALLRQAQEHLRAGRLETAIGELEQAHGRTHAPLLKLALGGLYNRAGRHEDAMRIAREALPALPRSALAQDIVGTAYLGLGRAGEALRAYREAVSLDPRQASVYARMGDAYWAMGRNDEALNYYREALNCDNGLLEAHLKIAAVLVEQGDADQSEAVLRQVLEQSPDIPLAHAVLGEAHLARGELAQARAHFLAAAAAQPDRPYLQLRLGEIHLREGEPARALALLEPLASRHPRHSQVQRLLAKAYGRSGRPLNAAYHEGLAAALEGRPGEAEGHFRTVLAGEPGHRGALLGLAAACLAQKKWAEAATAAGRAAEMAPPDAEAFRLLGQAQRGSGAVEEAERSLRRALAIDARHGPAHLELARLLRLRLRCAEALGHYQQALELGGDGDELRREMALCR